MSCVLCVCIAYTLFGVLNTHVLGRVNIRVLNVKGAGGRVGGAAITDLDVYCYGLVVILCDF